MDALVTEHGDALTEEIARRSAAGWIIVWRDPGEVQLMLPKRFGLLPFLAWTLLSLGTLVWVYPVWYWSKRNEFVYLRLIEGQVFALEPAADMPAAPSTGGRQSVAAYAVLTFGAIAITSIVAASVVVVRLREDDNGNAAVSAQPTPGSSVAGATRAPGEPAETRPPARATPVTPTPTPTATTGTPSPRTTFGDGLHIFGTEIDPGTYLNEGADGCYWERLSGFGGTAGEIIANGYSDAALAVTISATDAAFSTLDCGAWMRTGD